MWGANMPIKTKPIKSPPPMIKLVVMFFLRKPVMIFLKPDWLEKSFDMSIPFIGRLEIIFVHFVAKKFYWAIFPIFK
jgi:hypothetical protein